MSRWSGLSDVSLKRWIQEGATPLPSKIQQLCDTTGISLSWLKHGTGDTAVELAKVHAPPATPDADESPRVAEAATTISEVVQYISDHGDEEDVKMVEEILTAAQRRIRDRKASAGRGRRHVKYSS